MHAHGLIKLQHLVYPIIHSPMIKNTGWLIMHTTLMLIKFTKPNSRSEANNLYKIQYNTMKMYMLHQAIQTQVQQCWERVLNILMYTSSNCHISLVTYA